MALQVQARQHPLVAERAEHHPLGAGHVQGFEPLPADGREDGVGVRPGRLVFQNDDHAVTLLCPLHGGRRTGWGGRRRGDKKPTLAGGLSSAGLEV